jgi:hypothetical protein
MKQFVYKKPDNVFTALSGPTQIYTVQNIFPQFSISIYDFFDGTNFYYKRQSYNDQQVLSTLISDDNFIINNSNSYVLGQANPNKIFYAKIILFGPCLDTIGSPSNDFVCSITLNNVVSYYQMFCVNILNGYAIYSTQFSLINSDYYVQTDGVLYFNVSGSFIVNLSYPINLTISQASYNTPSYSTPTTTINGTTNNNSQYFSIVNLNFSTSYRLNNTSLFSSFNYSNSNTLFDTTPVLLNVTSQIIAIKIDFPTGQNFTSSGINYLGITLQNLDVNYAASAVIANVKVKTQNNIYNIQCNKYIKNYINTNFNNFIFNFKNIFLSSDNINYLIIEINLNNNSITSPTVVSFISFLKTFSNTFNAFSVQSLNENFTIDVFDNQHKISEVHKSLYLKNSNKSFVAESIINLDSDLCFEIATDNHKIKLDENMLIKGENNFLSVNDLSKGMLLETKNGLEKINSIKTIPNESLKLLDFDENTDYCLNGFYIKNPFYLKNFSRELLTENYGGDIQRTVVINDIPFIISNNINVNYTLKGNFTNVILIPNNITKITIVYECDNDVLFKYTNKEKLSNKNYITIEVNDTKKDILVRSISDILIKKIITL